MEGLVNMAKPCGQNQGLIKYRQLRKIIRAALIYAIKQ
jgi:hypothetical protein